MRFRLLIAFVATAFLGGCVNGYEKFYQPASMPSTGFAPFSGEPRLTGANADPRGTVYQMYQNGFGLVGTSNFTGPAQDQGDALNQAKKVGAAIVVTFQHYQNTVSGVLPMTTPTSSTSYTTGTASAYGTGGYASGTYSGTTTTYGSETTYIPYSVDRYAQLAMYFAPLQRRGIGIFANAITDSQKQQIGTNQAVQIVAIRNGSPAFLADVLPGDILFSIDGASLYDVASYQRAILQAMGHQVRLELLRNGQRMTKTVTVPPGDW